MVAGADTEIDTAARQRLHGRSTAVEIDDLGVKAFGLKQLLLDRDHDRDRGDRNLRRSDPKRGGRLQTVRRQHQRGNGAKNGRGHMPVREDFYASVHWISLPLVRQLGCKGRVAKAETALRILP